MEKKEMDIIYKLLKKCLLLILLLIVSQLAYSINLKFDDGYIKEKSLTITDPNKNSDSLNDDNTMWLNFNRIDDENYLSSNLYFSQIIQNRSGMIIDKAASELQDALSKMSGGKYEIKKKETDDCIILNVNSQIPKEGYHIYNKNRNIIISGGSEVGVLYGVYAFLKQVQLRKNLNSLNEQSAPTVKLRMLNHWDNLNGSVERGFAGNSIWNWKTLPCPEKKYEEYARILSSVGINGIVINNVNANVDMFLSETIKKYKGLADVFAPYGIKIFVSVNYATPIKIGKIKNADPLNGEVITWWGSKIEEIYRQIPNFGGFLVKADSEGQPGPLTYKRSHAQGANMFARLLKPYGGIVIWRAFVYDVSSKDRARQAYDFFKPLDGKFDDNVVLQVKNGPIDFQVNEPAHPLFGGLPATNQMIELQITQEYTGENINVNYLVPYWKKILYFDTFSKGKGSEIYKIINGSLNKQTNTGIAGVANIGDSNNWTGHTLAQANLYGFAKLAWDPTQDVKQMTDEWVKLTFGKNKKVVKTITDILLSSYETYSLTNAPYGVGYFFSSKERLNPAPNEFRKNYHFTDTLGIGYDRTVKTGSGYTGLYNAPVAFRYEKASTTPEEELLFFHHLPFTYKMANNKTLIQNIYNNQFKGVENCKKMIAEWTSLKGLIEDSTYSGIKHKMEKQLLYTEKWKNELLKFFYTMSGINDESKRLDKDIILNKMNEKFILEIPYSSGIKTWKLNDGDTLLNIEAEQGFISGTTIKVGEDKNDKFLSFNADYKSRLKDIAAFKFELPWGKINYYGFDKVISVSLRSRDRNVDTLLVKIDELEFITVTGNFYSTKWINVPIIRIGHLLGNGIHTVLIKSNSQSLDIDKIQLQIKDYWIDSVK